METGRIIATALFVAAGITLVLLTAAQVRERTRSAGRTALAAVAGVAAMILVGALMATVLPLEVTWAIVIVAGVVVTAMVLVS